MESPNSGFRFWQIIISLPCSGSLFFFSLIHSTLLFFAFPPFSSPLYSSNFNQSISLSISPLSYAVMYTFSLELFPLHPTMQFPLPFSLYSHTLSPQSVLPSPSTHVFPLLTSLSSSSNNFPLFLLPPVPFSLSFYTRTLSQPLPS